MLLNLLTPDLLLDRLADLCVADLQVRGIDGVLLDLDGTLKDHYAKILDGEAAAWVSAIRAHGIRLCIVSNGSVPYVERFAQRLELPFVGRACKPLPFRCRKLMRRLALEPARTALIGDQLFTDVLAGHLCGVYTIAIRSINTAEPWHTRVKRPLERRILRRPAEAPLPLSD